MSSHAKTKHLLKRDSFRRQFLAAKERGNAVALGKDTSNLFRRRQQGDVQRLNARDFNNVIGIDAGNMLVDVEGMTTYEALVDATLEYNCVPQVVPQLKTITIGGAVAGGGIESSSFKYGFVHETVEEMEILTGAGDVVICRADNEHSDLFHGFASSYGTLGYALRLKARILRAKSHVHLRHQRFMDLNAFYQALQKACAEGREGGEGPDFVDATAFGPNEVVLTTGTFCDSAPYTSNYTGMRVFYKSLMKREEDYLTTKDYIWRWDTDWFWCSRAFGAQFAPVRMFLWPLGMLRSTTYWKMRDFIETRPTLKKLALRGKQVEWVIQDVEIPVDKAAEFHRFLMDEIGILPFWICPAQAASEHSFDLYLTDPDTLYINFGFWGGVPAKDQPEGHFNRLVEAKVSELNGKKSLYSSAYYTEDEFWELYNKSIYDQLKAKYDPDHFFRNLYDKCVNAR